MASCVHSSSFSARALIFSTTSFLFFRFSCCSERESAIAALRASKNLLHAARKSFHNWSPILRGTIPTVFHSFCSSIILSAVAFHSVESCRACAAFTNSSFLAIFSWKPSLSFTKNSFLAVKNWSHAARKRSKIFTFIAFGAKPIFFHSA